VKLPPEGFATSRRRLLPSPAMPEIAFHFTAWAWFLAGCGALFVGLSKGGLTGVGILPVLFFAAVLPARESTGVVLPLLVVGDLCAVGFYWRLARWPVFWRLLPPALTGVVLGYFCMDRIPERAFGPVVGGIVLGLVALQLLRSALGERLDRFFLSHGFTLAMGGLAGVTTMIANAAGPVTNLYFLSIRLPKWELIGTAAWYFLVVNLFKVPFSAHMGLINRDSLILGVSLTPLVVVGIWAGRKLAGLLPQRQFELFVLLFSAFGAVRLILR